MKKYKLFKEKSKLFIGSVATGIGSSVIWGGTLSFIGKINNASDNTIMTIATISTILGTLTVPVTYHAFKQISLEDPKEDPKTKSMKKYY